MRKFAANYLVAENGDFLKNSILVAGEDGTVIEFIDTEGNLDEIAQLTFHNGILIAGYSLVRTNAEISVSESDHPVRTFVIQEVAGQLQLSIQNLIEIGEQVQNQFPEMKIPEILSQINLVLLEDHRFRKEITPGIFLLVGVDLVGLHFTSKTRLKKIL